MCADPGAVPEPGLATVGRGFESRCRGPPRGPPPPPPGRPRRRPPRPSVTHTGREHSSAARSVPAAHLAGDGGMGSRRRDPRSGRPPTRPRPIGAAQFYNLRRSATRHVIIDGRTRRDLTFHPLLSPTPSFPTRPGRGAASLPCEIAAPPDVTATPRTAERTTPTPTAVRIYTARGPHPKFVLRKPCRRPRRRGLIIVRRSRTRNVGRRYSQRFFFLFRACGGRLIKECRSG